MDEQGLRADVRAALSAVLRPRPAEAGFSFLGAGQDDLEAGRALLATLADGGWAVPTWPGAWGGRGATPDEAAVIAQELRRFDVPDLYPFMVGLALVGPTLLVHGSPEQHRRWLRGIANGEEIWCQLFSEPDAGSDLAALTTRAVREGGVWRVTGQKVWSSRAHYSRWGLLLARTDPEVPKHAGITAFAVEMTAPGVEIRPLRQMNGDTHFNEVFLTDVVVTDGDRIGAVGEGWAVAITTLMHERGALGPGGGPGRRELIEAIRGAGAGDDPVVRQRAAAVLAGLEVGRLTGLRAHEARRAGRPPGPEGSGAKLRGAAAVKALADLAVDVGGPAGLVGEDEWLTLFLTAPSISIRGGTDEIQRNILGERVLGLPPEPRPDKGVPFRAREVQRSPSP
ncbi:MAG: acyl-CoA dehydrogenase family protein [Acidimicrobiia bacterium]|nr:acyl-CoA dehydrogenase family protein [Acidimicrobiia bacterium]